MDSEPITAKTVFLNALEIPDAMKRRAFVAEQCRDNDAMLRDVERLLQHHAAQGSFLESPAGAATAESPVNLESPGAVIGPYKLLEQIGEGGFGVVFMAEQTHPVRRKVAVKVIKPGMDSKQVVARFEAERQALAMMDHVNIARVIDGGTTDAGRPFFVMELVHGVSITKYCDDNHLTPRERLELFVPVCHAIQHAHQKGVIHRDVKPSNVMITLYDGKPVPKVIDFGVAKATEQSLTSRTLFTNYGAMVGTLEYMSPEQAEMSALGVDTRSDIYSLGVLLYELLTGSTPLTHKRMKEAGFAEILRIIKEEEPPKPSTRLSDSGAALASISAQRRIEPAKLTKLVRGELDWIVMTCLEKDRNRRYETANGFAMDVQRYLADEPVQACPPSAFYRLKKFARRHKGPVISATLVLLALIAGVIGTSLGLIRAEQHRDVVERQRNELAEQNTALQAAHDRERLLNERARQAIETVTSETAIEQLSRKKDLLPEQKDFLDKMIQYYAESSQGTAATDDERSRQTRAYHRIGRMNQVLNRFQDSEKAYRRAVALGRQLIADFPAQPEFRLQLAGSLVNLAVLLRVTSRPAEVEAANAEALAIYEKLAADFPNEPKFRQGLSGIHNNLGNRFLEDGQSKNAESAYLKSLELRKKLVADFPDQSFLRRPLAMSHNTLGWLFHSTNRSEKAESAYRNAVAFQKQAVAEETNRPDFRLELAKYQFNLGNLLRETRRLKEAEAVYGEALPIRKQLAADFPNRPEFLEELANGHNSWGMLLRDTDRLPQAEAAYAEALAIHTRLAADFPKVSDYQNNVAGTLWNLANAAGIRRDFPAARRFLDKAVPYHLAALQANSRNTTYRQYYQSALVERSHICAAQGDRSAALAAATKRRDLGWDSASDAYEAATTLAQCVSIVEKDDKLDAPKRQAEMQFYADQAVAMLRDAVAKGYKDTAHMKQNRDLNPLRDRAVFKKLAADLETTPK
jgi:eukaryotic-like serine/threonine-protein kinase